MRTILFVTALLALGLAARGSATELCEAARDGDLSIVEKLLGADPKSVDVRDENGRTPLHWACQSGHTPVVKYLLEHGADANAKLEDNTTPLFICLRGRHPEAVRTLIENGADVNAMSDVGMTPFVLAVGYHDADLVRLMVEKADPAAVDPRGVTALHYSVARGIDDVAKALAAGGADINAAISNGKTVLQIAEDYGREELALWLSERGAARPESDLTELTGDYLGMKPPGMTPEVFAPGALMMPYKPHGALAFSPNGDELFYAYLAVPINAMWTMKRVDGRWTSPSIASFSQPTSDADLDGDPFVTYDGKRLYFRTCRESSAGGGAARRDSDIWYCERTASGWGEPQNLGAPINTERYERSPAVTRDGTLYFVAEGYEDGLGESDIYRSRFVDGRYTTPENLGPKVNSEHHDLTCYIAPDDGYIVFASTRPGGFGFLDLYVSFHNPDDTWSPAVNMGEEFNQGMTWHPFVTADGRFLFFMRGGRGRDDFYWVDAGIIDRYRGE